jgi:hypothetical protein
MMATRGATSPPLPLLRCSAPVPRTAAVYAQQRRRAAAPLRTNSSVSNNSSSSSSSSSTRTTGTAAFDIAERMRWLEQDLSHLFDDTGVDPKGYDDKVEFLDPITRYDSVQGYLFNIKFLRAAFTPEFTLHDMRATGPYEVTTRWTMAMRFAPARALKIDKWWDPEITFTGTPLRSKRFFLLFYCWVVCCAAPASPPPPKPACQNEKNQNAPKGTSAYGFNPANGRINRHIDTWDSVANQKFFSLEAFGDFLRQLTSTATAPKGLETPDYVLLRRAARYQVRRYAPFVIAVAPLDGVDESSSASDNGASSGNGSGSGTGSSSGVNPASKGVRAFRDLAGYLFGGNADGRKMRMTAPVLSSTDGTMAFVIGRSDAEVRFGGG